MALRIVVFAKAPSAGFAKTRLIPALGQRGAAALARQLLYHSVQQALAARIGSVELCVTPSQDDPIWHQLALPGELTWSSQTDGDLGQRLADACQRVLHHGEVPILMGTDCPQLTAKVLQSMGESLRDHDACMVPVHDGGYATLGLRFFDESIFRNMPWSTDTVASLTRERIRALGRTLHEMAPLHDIDEPADLQWLPARWHTGDTTTERNPMVREP